VRKAPGGAGAAPAIFFWAAFLRSFCSRRLSFPGLGNRGGGGPGGPLVPRPPAIRGIEVPEMSILHWRRREQQLAWPPCPPHGWRQMGPHCLGRLGGCRSLAVRSPPPGPKPSRGLLSLCINLTIPRVDVSPPSLHGQLQGSVLGTGPAHKAGSLMCINWPRTQIHAGWGQETTGEL
jgi:hypothetical protein